MMEKWSSAYWVDLGERVAASALGGLLAMVTVTSVAELSWSYAWAVVGVPTATSLLKGLLANLPGGVPSASAANVSSVGAAPERTTGEGV